MIVLRINQIIVGLLLCVYGALILFLRRYALASFFMSEDKKKGKSLKKYAVRVGRLFFFAGLWFVFSGIVSFFFGNTLTVVQFAVCVIIFLIGIFTR